MDSTHATKVAAFVGVISLQAKFISRTTSLLVAARHMSWNSLAAPACTRQPPPSKTKTHRGMHRNDRSREIQLVALGMNKWHLRNTSADTIITLPQRAITHAARISSPRCYCGEAYTGGAWLTPVQPEGFDRWCGLHPPAPCRYLSLRALLATGRDSFSLSVCCSVHESCNTTHISDRRRGTWTTRGTARCMPQRLQTEPTFETNRTLISDGISAV